MKYDGMYRVMTAEEERALATWLAARARTDAMIKDLVSPCSGREPAGELDAAITEREAELLHVIHTRLVRCLPHLADVIALCVWPEYMPLPDWVAVGGEPRPALYPAAAASRIYRW